MESLGEGAEFVLLAIDYLPNFRDSHLPVHSLRCTAKDIGIPHYFNQLRLSVLKGTEKTQKTFFPFKYTNCILMSTWNIHLAG